MKITMKYFSKYWTQTCFLHLRHKCASVSAKRLSRKTMASNVKYVQNLTEHDFKSSFLSLPVFCFGIAQHTDRKGRFFHTCTKHFLVCLQSLHQCECADYTSLPKQDPRITSVRSNAAYPIHYIWFTLASASTSASTSTELLHAFSLAL